LSRRRASQQKESQTPRAQEPKAETAKGGAHCHSGRITEEVFFQVSSETEQK
jgi:hypothetical protein